jgi:hypothetical protein
MRLGTFYHSAERPVKYRDVSCMLNMDRRTYGNTNISERLCAKRSHQINICWRARGSGVGRGGGAKSHVFTYVFGM